MQKLFDKEGEDMPGQLTFELLSKQFMSLASERYPSSSKVLLLAQRMGIEKWLMAKIIVFSQLRDAVREVAVNQIFKSIQHRDELYLAIIEALEDLEDELEDIEFKEEEKDEEEKEQKGRNKNIYDEED